MILHADVLCGYTTLELLSFIYLTKLNEEQLNVNTHTTFSFGGVLVV